MFAASKTDSASTGDYQISRSLRFNSADSAYLNRTPASAGNRRTWTFSTWVKRSQLSSGNAMLATVNGSALNYFAFGTSTGDFLAYAYFDGASDVFGVNTSGTSVFRDVSAWYHIVLSVDTTQATAANRVKIYVNNVEQTLGGTYPTQNYDTPINNSIPNLIGGGTGSYTAYLADQYMTEVNFIDGQALTPSSFGETDTQTGVWKPKAYSGSYGTNGFYLNFSDNSNTTATTLGKDYSGNGNNWTPNNFSVTAGAGNDSLVDVPTPYGVDTGVGGEVRGNYATLNPLAFNSAPGGTGQSTFSNGNLQAVNNAVSWTNCFSTISMNSGKFYFEFTVLSGSADAIVGIYNVNTAVGAMSDYVGHTSSGYVYYIDGTKGTGGSFTAYGSSWTTGDIIGVALDLDAGTLVFYKNGTSQGTAFSGLSGNFVFAMTTYYTNSFKSCNFGQRPFAYTAPSGFKALCTQNLPTPTIGATTATQAGKFFNAVTYTGTGSSLGVTGVGFQPDWVWVKSRSGATDHGLYDAVRGVQKQLESNTASDETTETTGITAFGSDGFTTGALAQLNTSSATYVAWNWKANGAGSSNTAGSITSTVSASTTSGFSVLTYSGTGAAATVGHGLSAVPQMIIVKCRTTAFNWRVYHVSVGNVNSLLLNSDGASSALSSWNSTTPTSTVFTVGTDVGTNQSGSTFVAYCFAAIAGYSAFGTYTGNGSTDGPFVFTGFRPAYVMVKRTDAVNVWLILDATRNPSNVVTLNLNANTSVAENTYSGWCDFTSNGFKVRGTDTAINATSGTYIYMAFASNPFKYSLAR
jgi:hypothetical protein